MTAAVAALPLLPELGPPGWVALGVVGLGYGAYAGYQWYKSRSQSSQDGSEADKANEKADDKAAQGDQAQACSTCKPECEDLYKTMQDLTKDLSQRRGAMLADPAKMYDLYLKDPTAKVPDPRNPGASLGSWLGHQKQITEQQRNLNRQMKQYQKQGCSGGLPPGAETQAGLDPPTKPFK